jgi:hypothetical protein
VRRTRQWTSKQAQKTRRFPDRTFTRRGTFHSPAVGSTENTRTKARIPGSVQFCKKRRQLIQVFSHVNVGSQRRQVGRRRRHRIPSEPGSHVRRGLETEAVEPRRDQSYHGRGNRNSLSKFGPPSEPMIVAPSSGDNAPSRRGQHERSRGRPWIQRAERDHSKGSNRGRRRDS